MPKSFISKELSVLSLEDLPEVAKEIVVFSGNAKIWLFEGEMGVGKTTLIKEICKILGVTANVTSPTYSLVNEYQGENGKDIYHFDFYRIKKEEEAMDIGCDEYFYSGNLCLIEWPEKIPNLIPDKYFLIKIALKNMVQRAIQLQRYE